MKFISSSPTPSDLQNKVSINKLEVMAGNILYLTHEIDQIKKLINQLIHDNQLQNQTDEYYGEAHPGRGLPLEDMAKDGST